MDDLERIQHSVDQLSIQLHNLAAQTTAPHSLLAIHDSDGFTDGMAESSSGEPITTVVTELPHQRFGVAKSIMQAIPVGTLVVLPLLVVWLLFLVIYLITAWRQLTTFISTK